MDKCPKCDCTELSGMYHGFYAPLDKNGEDKAINFGDHASSTELSTQRSCHDCGHEFDLDDIGENMDWTNK